MLPERIIAKFENAILNGKNYISHTVIIDDPLTISVIIDYMKRYQMRDENGVPYLTPDLSIALADSLSDRYIIPEDYSIINYYPCKRKEMI